MKIDLTTTSLRLDDNMKEIAFYAWRWTEQTGWQWVKLSKAEISKIRKLCEQK